MALGGVHWRRWRLGLDSMQLALVVACLLSAGALLSLEVGRPWHLAWWDYHAFLLAGFAAAVYTVVSGYRRSSTLHDVLEGVFASDPMAKPGALTDEERAWIQEHPVVGADIVGRAPSLRDALTVIRQHHERYDGPGYPDGLAGEEISLAARIVAVADVWDPLTSDRAYRPAEESCHTTQPPAEAFPGP